MSTIKLYCLSCPTTRDNSCPFLILTNFHNNFLLYIILSQMYWWNCKIFFIIMFSFVYVWKVFDYLSMFEHTNIPFLIRQFPDKHVPMVMYLSYFWVHVPKDQLFSVTFFSTIFSLRNVLNLLLSTLILQDRRNPF